ncbi:MAG: hypothetical protein ABIC95_02185 [archaeon]
MEYVSPIDWSVLAAGVNPPFIETTLNLGRYELFGWETDVSDKVIDSIVQGIELSDDIPAVNVRMIAPGYFELNSPYGGHNRAVAHYRAGVLLKIRLNLDGKFEFPMIGRMNFEYGADRTMIKDIEVRDDRGDYEIRKRDQFYR